VDIGLIIHVISYTQKARLNRQENHEDYANTVAQMLKSAMVRTKVYTGNESLGKRIHKAKQYKPFYVLVIGDKEVASNTYSLENRTGEKITSSHDTLIQTLLPLITNRQ
jgi:threonyl-tRNA synthetase